ncbi:senataxin, partial [Tremellales sp. Uapishka_1]
MSSDGSSMREVEEILAARLRDQAAPQDAILNPVYNLLLPTSTASSSSRAKKAHWYCSQALSSLHTEAATYLLFIFAFRREGTSKAWIEALEAVLGRCEKCARGFGAARRIFGSKYISTYPAQTRTNFFAAVDKWQANLILSEYDKASETIYGASNSATTLLSLPTSIVQLLFSEPTLLSDPKISTLLDSTISSSSHSLGQSSVTSLGLTPLLVCLLHSENSTKREWARSLLPSTSRRPLSFHDWCATGVGDQVQKLYSEIWEGDSKEKWRVTIDLINSGGLSIEAARRGLIEGNVEEERKSSKRGLAAVLSGLLGTKSDTFPVILECFAALLALSPSRHIWSFDSSADFPHTLFSEIRKNPSFLALLVECYPSIADPLDSGSLSDTSISSKGKEKEINRTGPISWVTNFLLSLVDLETGDPTKDNALGFAEALAKIIHCCFKELQHVRFTGESRAAAASAGFQALLAVQTRIPSTNKSLQSSLTSTLDVHALFIATVALQPKDHPSPTWSDARHHARDLLTQIFLVDGNNIAENMLSMALASYNERRRKQKEKRKLVVGPPDKIDKLPVVSVRKDLWSTTYEALSPQDVKGIAILMKAVVPFSHMEKLDRTMAWSAEGLEKVVDEAQWTVSVRAINSSLAATRDKQFPSALEALATLPDPTIVRSLWQQPNLGKVGIVLLLSPAAEVHDPVMDVIRQSFDEVDDRGDCFRVLLQKFPDAAMDGLADFLRTFIQTAQFTPESCYQAKWLVRCFTDILEVLCRPSESCDALLQTEDFLASYSDGKRMSKRIGLLWQLMNSALALIFKRTVSWADYYSNEIMTDWMRDALIFGRCMVDYIRSFEAAMLGQTADRFNEKNQATPVKTTSVGKSMVLNLAEVLKNLVPWFRLTDLETLHQTHELVKTILGRIGKSKPDLSQNRDLESTLLEIDKFVRKVSKSYGGLLSDVLRSELADLLLPFDLPMVEEDDVVFVEQVRKESSATESKRPAKPVKNAFEQMMKGSGSSTPKLAPIFKAGSTKQAAIEIEDDFDDFFSELSAADLDKLEKGEKVVPHLKPTKPSTKAPPAKPSQFSKLNINVVPKPPPPKPAPGRTHFKSSLMQNIRQEVRADNRMKAAAAKRDEGRAPKLPAASTLGTGLGANTSRPRVIQPVESSGSSASESETSSDDEKGVSALIARQKAPPQAVKHVVERRQIKMMDSSLAHILREKDDKRARAHAIKQRLRPDLSLLYRHVISWNPDHTGTTVPHHPKFAAGLASMGPVPSTFASGQDYEKTMLPLFLQELWAQCGNERNRSQQTLTVEVTGRTYEDDYIDLSLLIPGDAPFGWYASDTDIVSLQQPGNAEPILAKVQSYKKTFRGMDFGVRILAMLDRPALSGKSRWQLQKYISLGTAFREFGALKGLPYYETEILKDVLDGKSATPPCLSEDEVRQAMGSYDLNEPQAKAVLGAMSVDGFSLIQGPPGTGKTKTISGLVSKFLTGRKAFISVNGEKPPKSKLLICAPSNAAIDEVCKRLMDGIPGVSNDRRPSIVRIGQDSSVNIAVKDISLDMIVEAKINADNRSSDGGKYGEIQKELEQVKDGIKSKLEELKNVQGHDEAKKRLGTEIHALTAERTRLGQALSRAKDASRDATRHLDGARRAAREAALNDADIICSTLSGAGQESLSASTFEMVIIDEAAQAIELSCLIPLKYGCRRCVMVGDPNQLPPTTFSTEAEKFNYNQSLFVRIANLRPGNVQLLSIQYRMHPFISELPSKVFYNSQLMDGPGMDKKTAAIWHQRNIFGPYRFFNVEGNEVRAQTSTKNPQEAVVAVELYHRLEADFGTKINLALRVGVITMYREQLMELKRKFVDAFGPQILEMVEFNTVDGFQGQEKDIIILSCVRSGPNLRQIGFLKDFRRMNVALTRAKSSLFVIGNGPTLERSDERWKTIVGDARDRGFYIDYTPTIFAAQVMEAPKITKPKKEKEEQASKSSKKSMETPALKGDLLTPKALAASMKRNSDDDISKKEKKKKVEELKGLAKANMPIKPPPPTSEPPPSPPPVPVASHSAPAKRPLPPQASTGASTSKSQQPRGPAPPPPPPRPVEDVLFRKKKKPNKAPTGAQVNVRALLNEKLHGAVTVSQTSAPQAAITSSPSEATPPPMPTAIASGAAYVSQSGDSCGAWGCGEIMSAQWQASYYPIVTAWGWNSMNCGYGYGKSSGGYCTPLGWYQTSLGCYETTIIQEQITTEVIESWCYQSTMTILSTLTKTSTEVSTATQVSTKTEVQTTTVTQTQPTTVIQMETMTETQPETEVQTATQTQLETATKVVTATQTLPTTVVMTQLQTLVHNMTETMTQTETMVQTTTIPTTIMSTVFMTKTMTEQVPTTVQITKLATETDVMTQFWNETTTDTQTKVQTQTQAVTQLETKTATETAIQTQIKSEVSTQVEKLTATEVETATEENTLTKVINNVSTATELQTQTQLATVTQNQVSTQTEVATKTEAVTHTATDVISSLLTATKTQTDLATQTEIATKTEVQNQTQTVTVASMADAQSALSSCSMSCSSQFAMATPAGYQMGSSGSGSGSGWGGGSSYKLKAKRSPLRL